MAASWEPAAKGKGDALVHIDGRPAKRALLQRLRDETAGALRAAKERCPAAGAHEAHRLSGVQGWFARWAPSSDNNLTLSLP